MYHVPICPACDRNIRPSRVPRLAECPPRPRLYTQHAPPPTKLKLAPVFFPRASHKNVTVFPVWDRFSSGPQTRLDWNSNFRPTASVPVF